MSRADKDGCVVIAVARMIAPGAYSVWFDGTGPDAKGHAATTRQMYERASAECLAVEIIKRLSALSSDALKQALIANEIDGWSRYGIDASVPELKKIVERKYD